jgi:hypothetical protein
MMRLFALFLVSAGLGGWLAAPFASAQPVAQSLGPVSEVSESWQFSITPYAWALGIRGSVSHDGSQLGQVNLKPGSVLSNLKMAGMLTGQANYGRLGLYVDAMYGDLGNTTSRVVQQTALDASTRLKMTLLSLAPTYTLLDSPTLYLDGLLGARVMWQSATTTLTSPSDNRSLSKSSSIRVADAIVGLKGRWNLAHSPYFVPFYVDVGTGQYSSFTSQAYLGIGRSFSWGDISLVAKNVYYQFKPNNTQLDLNMFGAALGVTFKF